MRVARRCFAGIAVAALAWGHAVAAGESPGASAAFGEWSDVVNGLQARVAGLQGGGGYTDGVFVELRNAGEMPLNVPSLFVVAGGDLPWRLQVREGDGWADVPWGKSGGAGVNMGLPGMWNGGEKPVAADAPAVVLRSGKTALVQVNNLLDEKVRRTQEFRLVIAQAGTGPVAGWTGTLTTPPGRTHVAEKAREALRGKLAAPDYFPALGRSPVGFANGSGDESMFERVYVSDERLFAQLALYQDAPVARELENRLKGERDFTMRLLLAEQAALRGSAAGKDCILEAMKDLDYGRCKSTLDALQFMAEADETPEWAFDAMIAALKDQRVVKNLPEGWDAQTRFTVSDLAFDDSNLALRLGEKKCKRAVPALIEMAKSGKHRSEAIEALGDIGDPAAVPVLFEIVRGEREDVSVTGGELGPATYAAALSALVDLKAAGVEGELLACPATEGVVKLLEKTGDPRGVPVLQRTVSNSTDRELVEAAKIALATLEPGDPVPRYCALVQDQSLGEFTRREAVWRMGEKGHIDARAIPVLLKAAREDSSGAVVDNSIAVLGGYHYAAAVGGLIDLFGADFGGKRNWKYAYSPEMFREHIADSLEKVTGEAFGDDPGAWRQWWAGQDKGTFK